MKAIYNDVIIAEAAKEDLIYIEGNWYFPPTSVHMEYLLISATPYTCPWKGVCQYFDITIEGVSAKDVAWTYPDPLPTALDRVKKDFSSYVAFWREVRVEE